MTAITKYPAEFLMKMKSTLGSEYDNFLSSLENTPPVSIRLNPFKRISKFDGNEPIPWCGEGRYLQERPSFTFDPHFHAGTYYVQEASSMFIEQFWKVIHPENKLVRILDLCAAPGGKSTHLLSLINNQALLVSNEVVGKRNNILRQNIAKWGSANCIVTQNKPEDFSRLGNFFDFVLVDAPCSGEGLFRKDKSATDEWSLSNVAMCSARQKEILKYAIQCLKPGGFLIYSTCTFEAEENDDNMSWLHQSGMHKYHLPLEWPGAEKTKYGLQFYPHKIRGEGFYIAAMQKEISGNRTTTIGLSESRSKGSALKDKTRAMNIRGLIETYFENAGSFKQHIKADMLFAIPDKCYSDFQFLEKNLYIRHAGIFMGSPKGNDFLPSHDLGMSIDIKSDLPSVELNEAEAVSYLRGEPPKLKIAATGWHLAKFENRNLGWIKILDGRINNYYPKELRILKRH